MTRAICTKCSMQIRGADGFQQSGQPRPLSQGRAARPPIMPPDRRHHGRGLRAVHAAHGRYGCAPRRRPDVLRAVVARDFSAMPVDVALGGTLCRSEPAVTRPKPTTCAKRWCAASASVASISLAFAMTGARTLSDVEIRVWATAAPARASPSAASRGRSSPTDESRMNAADRTRKSHRSRAIGAR